jgi:hypothetical protein
LLSNNGFHAYILKIFTFKAFLSLYELNTLEYNLGCFPFDFKPFHLKSNC